MDEDRPEITIESLNLQFDVAADAQERVFAELFRKYIELYARNETATRELADYFERDRTLDFDGGG